MKKVDVMSVIEKHPILMLLTAPIIGGIFVIFLPFLGIFMLSQVLLIRFGLFIKSIWNFMKSAKIRVFN